MKKDGGRVEVGRETPLPDNPHYWARKGGVSVRLCRGDGVSAGNVMGGCSQVQPCWCGSSEARVPGPCMFGSQSLPGIVTNKEKRNGKVEGEGWKDRQRKASKVGGKKG